MPIDNTTVVPIIYAARLLDVYRKRRVFTDRVDRQWQGQLANGGDTVRLNIAATGSVADYEVGGTVTYRDADVVHLGDLTLTKQKSFAVQLDDIPAIQANVGVLDAAVEEDGIALAQQVDADTRAVMDANATPGPAIAIDYAAEITADNFRVPYLHRLMDVARLPRDGRWVIIGPYTAEMLMRYSLQNAILNAPVNNALRNGVLGTWGGLTWYVASADDSVVTPGASAADPVSVVEEWFYGNDSATAFIDQIRRVEQLRRETTFADAVRGLYTYGVKVHRPERLRKSAVTISNVPA